MKSFSEIRSINYKHRKDDKEEFFVNIDDWIMSPYTSLKARYYIEVSSLIVYLLQFTKVTPNQVSVLYALLGFASGFLLSLDNKTLIYVGLTIFVLKGAVDWADGLLARVTNKTSGIGHVIDTWGSHVGHYSLIFGIGIISYNNLGEAIYLKITSIIFLLSLIDFKLFGYHQLFYEILNKKLVLKENSLNETKIRKYKNESFIDKCKIILNSFLDDRARTLDLICLVIFIETLYNTAYFTKIILILFLIKKIAILIGNFFEIVILQKLKDKV